MVAVMEWWHGYREVSGEELAHYERLSEKRQPAELPVIEQPKRARRCQKCDGIFIWHEATATGKPPTLCTPCRTAPKMVRCAGCGTEIPAHQPNTTYCSTQCRRAFKRLTGGLG